MTKEYNSKGVDLMNHMDPNAIADLERDLKDFAPDLVKYAIDFAYGEVIPRPGLDLRSKEIATIAALTTLGHPRPELKTHIKKALHIGITVEELKELMIHLMIYTGFPTAINGMTALKEVVEKRS